MNEKGIDYQIRHPQDINEIIKVFSMLKVCFPKIDRAYFIKRILGDSYYNKSHTYLLAKGNSFISHVQLFKRKIYCYGKQLPVVGLGAICTLPEYRNKGYSKTLLEKVIQDIRDKHIPFIILLTRLPRFYEKLGFVKIIRRYYLLERKEAEQKRSLNRKGLRIRRFNFEQDILSIMEIYENFFKGHFGPVVREFKDWQAQLSYFNEDRTLFLVLEDKKEVKAYIRCKRSGKAEQNLIDVVEFASQSQDNSFLVYLLNYLFKFTGSKCLRMDSRLSRDNLSQSFKVETVDDSLLMYRPVKADRAINSLKMKGMVSLEGDAF